MKHLTKDGYKIYEQIKGICTDRLGIEDADDFELKMLANSFYLYMKYADICNETGCTQKPKAGGWDQVRPEYTIMKNEYQNILKHSGKFGLNPSDRAKIVLDINEHIHEALNKYEDKSLKEVREDLGHPQKVANHYRLDRGLKT